MSPDAGRVAVLSTARDGAVLAVVDVATGARWPIWSAPGGWSAESGVSWSSDGRRIAVTYLEEDAEEDEERAVTVVVDPAGTVLARLVDANVPPASHGAWTGDGDLAVTHEDDGELHVVALSGAAPVAVGTGHRGEVLAVVGDRLVTDGSDRERTILLTTALDGTAPRPLVRVRPRLAVHFVDLAPTLLSDVAG
jgi:hypothetical protein